MPRPPDSSLSRRERERRRRRQAMLDAARSVFAEKGYADATLDEIAEQAEFGKGTLYNYFERGKEGLLFAVFADILDEIEALIRTVFRDEYEDDGSLRDAFHTFAEGYFKLIRDREDLFLLLVKEAHLMAFSDDAEKVQFFREQHQRLVDALTPIIEGAVEKGEIQPLPPESVANLLLANVRGLGTHCTLEKHHCSCEEQQFLSDPEKGADFLTSFLFDGLATTGTPLS